MAINIILFLVGLVILIYSSNWLIQGCTKFSSLFRLTPLFVGMVLVAFGTSAPEAGIGIMAAIRNQKAIALGNIIGSNIANIGLVLGLCAIFRPLKVDKAIFKREVPIMLASAGLLYILCWDLLISRLDGLVFILAFIGFCLVSYKGSRNSFDKTELQNFKLKKSIQNLKSRFAVLGVILAAILGVVLGADLMVRAGSTLAKSFGISPWIIGITVFAIGTSLPELAASLTASLKKISSISIGNIVGSNIFNILFVLGVVSLIRPINLEPSVLKFELPALIFFSAFLFTVMRSGYRITRLEGIVMFLTYLTFIGLVIIR